MMMDGVLERIDEDAVVDVCRRLVQFKTVDPPGEELEIARYAATYLRDAGLEAEVMDHGSDRGSVVARLKGRAERRPVVFCGHLDVVPTGSEPWEHDPFGGALAEGRVWGRGSSDMKGGVAAMMVAAETLASAEVVLDGDLILLLTADEEVGQMGARALAARPDLEPAQAVIISEPSHNQVYVAEKGQFWVRLTTHGRIAHGSMPHLGRNAIQMMATLLVELDQLPLPGGEHPLLGTFTRSVGTIQGGESTNIVPDKCVVTLDQRLLPGQDRQGVLDQLDDLVAKLEERRLGFSASVETISYLPPVETSPDHPVVRTFCQVVEEVTGTTPQPGGVSYGTDGAVLAPRAGRADDHLRAGQPGSGSPAGRARGSGQVGRVRQDTDVERGAASDVEARTQRGPPVRRFAASRCSSTGQGPGWVRRTYCLTRPVVSRIRGSPPEGGGAKPGLPAVRFARDSSHRLRYLHNSWRVTDPPGATTRRPPSGRPLSNPRLLQPPPAPMFVCSERVCDPRASPAC